MPFASSFAIGTATVNFGAVVMGHEDRAGALRELSCSCHFASEADWNTFRTFLNWNLEVVPMPWGTTVEVLVKGGPGSGTLTISALTPPSYTAWMSELTRTWRNVNTGHSTGKAKFILNAT